MTNRIHTSPSTTLRAAVAAAYQVFGPYKIGKTLVVCHCRSCMTEATEARLVSTPLREISVELLREFTNSAHGDGKVEEVKYFLPRYFDLLADGLETSDLGLGLSLTRLEAWDWRLWPEEEARAVETVLRALFHDALNAETPPGRWELEDVLIMLTRVRLDPAALIEEVVAGHNKKDLTAVARLSTHLSHSGDSLSSEFWRDLTPAAERVVKTLKANATLAALLKAVEDPENNDLNDELSAAFEVLT